MSGSNSIREQWGTAPSITVCLLPSPNHAELSGEEPTTRCGANTVTENDPRDLSGGPWLPISYLPTYLPTLSPTANKLYLKRTPSGDFGLIV